MSSTPFVTSSSLMTSSTHQTGSSPWLNKLKIVGSGQNWSVAPCEQFYLMGTEPLASDAILTGAKNLIEHYGLENAYQKFCGRKLRHELSSFLPHLSGNVNVAASEDGSGLLSLIERPPIRGKDLVPFAASQLDHGFRLHPGPLPREYMALFMAPPSTTTSDQVGGACVGVTPSTASSSAPGFGLVPSQSSRNPITPVTSSQKKRRCDVHRGPQSSTFLGATSSSTSFGAPLVVAQSCGHLVGLSAQGSVSGSRQPPPTVLNPSPSSHNAGTANQLQLSTKAEPLVGLTSGHGLPLTQQSRFGPHPATGRACLAAISPAKPSLGQISNCAQANLPGNLQAKRADSFSLRPQSETGYYEAAQLEEERRKKKRKEKRKKKERE